MYVCDLKGFAYICIFKFVNGMLLQLLVSMFTHSACACYIAFITHSPLNQYYNEPSPYSFPRWHGAIPQKWSKVTHHRLSGAFSQPLGLPACGACQVHAGPVAQQGPRQAGTRGPQDEGSARGQHVRVWMCAYVHSDIS